MNCDPSSPALVYQRWFPVRVRGYSLLAECFVGRYVKETSFVSFALPIEQSQMQNIADKVFGVKGQMKTLKKAYAGQIVAFDGTGEVSSKAGTLTNSATASPIREMDLFATPILQHSVKAKHKSEHVRMVRELHRIVAADSIAVLYKDQETDKQILAGARELHLEVLVSSLLRETGIEIELSEPLIAYKEIVRETGNVALAKSDNHHNRIFVKASPLAEEVVESMASGSLDPKCLGLTNADCIWATGPDSLGSGVACDHPSCLLVDSTFGLQIPRDARDNISAAFKQLTRAGVLVNCPMSGVRFDVVDALRHGSSQTSLYRSCC